MRNWDSSATRLDGDGARPVERRLGIDGDRGGFAGGVDQQLVGRLGRLQRAAVDGQQIVALLDVQARLGERRAGLRIPVFAGIDLLEAVATGRRVEFIVGAQQSLGHGMQAGILGPIDVSVRVGEFADHLAQDVSEIVAAGDIGKQNFVLLPHRFPIHAVHAGLEEVIALLPPDLVEDLPPLGGRIDLQRAARRDSARRRRSSAPASGLASMIP